MAGLLTGYGNIAMAAVSFTLKDNTIPKITEIPSSQKIRISMRWL